MLLAILPAIIIDCWKRGKAAKIVLSAILLLLVVKFFLLIPFSKNNQDYQIIDLSDAFDSGNKRTKTDYIVIHHTAMPSHIRASVLKIAQIHMQENGWSTIGYQYLIMNGKIYRLHNDDEVAPHTYGHNSTSIGVCVHGDYNIEQLSEDDKSKLVWLVDILKAKYRLSENQIVRHGDLNNTDCCGRNINLNDIRKCLKK